MPEFKKREEQKNNLEESFNRTLSREVMARKRDPHAIRDIPTVVMKDLRPWYSYMGFPLDEDGFPILDEMR